MKKRLVALVLVSLLITLSSSVSASFRLGNGSEIETSYAPSDYLRGWINISLRNEPSNSLLSSNFQGSIKIKDFLDENIADYFCIPADCEDNYVLSNGQLSKSFSLSYGQEKLISFLINGMISSINSLKFDVSVSNPSSCINPLKIDLFNDEIIEWKAREFGNDFSCTYQGGTGCFNASETLSEWVIVQKPYCEKIGLTESGKFNLGAWVKKGSTSWQASLLKMTLYDLAGTELANCNLPEPSSSGGEISCTVEYENDKIQEYYVCIKASQDTDYKVKRESVSPCGFHAVPGEETEYHDYYIFAKAARFENIGKISFNQQEYETQGNENLAEDILNYLDFRYGKNCSAGCSIPFRFKSYSSLNIVLSNLSLSYSTSGGTPPAENKIYDAVKEAGKISSGFLELDLSLSGISVPSSYGNRTLELYLAGEKILSQDIYIERLPVIKNVFPKIVSAAVPTLFKANVSSPSNASIVSYVWDFGDGEEETTNANSVTHIYSEMGYYILVLSVEDSDGLTSSKEFMIIAGNPKEAANSTLKKYRERITNLTGQINQQPSWYQNELKEVIGLDSLDNNLKSLERKFSLVSEEEEFTDIMSNLTEMQVPVKIGKSSQGSFPVFLDIENINLDYLESLGAGSYENASEEEYEKAILKWYDDNLQVNADYYTFSAYYDKEVLPLLSYFKLRIIAEENEIENYLIINGEVKVNTELYTKEFDDAIGVKFPELKNREVEFVVIGEILPLEILIYMSPEFNKFDVSQASICNADGVCDKPEENWKNCRADCKPSGLIVFYVVLLILGAFIAYIVMQEWYKRKYESHLFKNRNDLFNLVNFVNNALNRGVSKQEIEKRLKQSGWNSEQIDYAFKKVKGKKLMPIEINLLKFFEKKIKTTKFLTIFGILGLQNRKILIAVKNFQFLKPENFKEFSWK